MVHDVAAAFDIAAIALHAAAAPWGSTAVGRVLRQLANRFSDKARSLRREVEEVEKTALHEVIETPVKPLEDDSKTERVTLVYGDKSSKP